MHAPITHLLYLHGFRSSPQSAKAVQVQRWLAARAPQVVFACPQLPPSPAEAMRLVEALVRDWPDAGSVVFGSSLGGFMAATLAERRGWPAVLLNPAVDPARDLAAHLGTQPAWHDPETTFTYTHDHLDELRAMEADPARPLRHGHRHLAVIATGDEVLDWREMAARHAAATQIIVSGSDHALSDFEAGQLPQVMRHLGLGA